jgi:ubiquinone/menaquinone biosynthesis C-methylase UbiE
MLMEMARVALLIPAVAVCCLGSAAFAQEESVNPGINEHFEDPDVETWIARFEREEREVYARREEIAGVLELRPGMDVADIGAGTGFFSVLFARQVGPEGSVYAVDIAESFVKETVDRAERFGLANVEGVVNPVDSIQLADGSIDVAFVCNTYHHFEYPFKMLESIRSALRPDGVLVVVDYERVRGVTRKFIFDMVRAGKGTFTDEIRDAGFDLVEEIPFSDEVYILEFRQRKPVAEASSERQDERREADAGHVHLELDGRSADPE